MTDIEQDRPFLEHWDTLWKLELRRKQGEFGGSGISMMLTFLRDIGYHEFLVHAKRTKAVMEIAKYYENSLQTVSDLDRLVVQI